MPSPSRAPGYAPPAHPDFFTQVAVSLDRCPNLTPVEKTTYRVLLSYADADGRARPGQLRLAGEVGVSEPTLRRALARLTALGLITPRRRGQGRTNEYQVTRIPLRGRGAEAPAERKRLSFKNENGVRSRAQTVFVESDRREQESEESDQPPPTPALPVGEGGGARFSTGEQERITTDTVLLVERLGMAPAVAQATAAEAVAAGQPPGYVAELVEHATSTPGIANPAGVVRALVQRGERRPRWSGGVPPRGQRAALRPEHYQPGGKYAHLFARPAPAADDPTPPHHTSHLTPHTSPLPSAFDIQANPALAGGDVRWPRGQPEGPFAR